MKIVSALVATGLIASLPASAATTVLDFDASQACNTACIDGRSIRQTYGDSADLDVTYQARNDFGDASIFVTSMFWWGSGFGDLQGVGYVSRVAEIRLELLKPGKQIRLNSFDMARFTGTAETDLRVYDLGWNLLWSAEGQFAPGGQSLSYAPGVLSTSGLVIQHGPQAANRGLDNISFTISNAAPAIPEPASWAMLLAGFGLTGALARRRAMAQRRAG